MSSKGDFQDFDFDNVKPNQNMEQFMDKVDKFSIDWDNFDAPNNDEKSGSHSAVSDVFNQSKKSMSQKSQKSGQQDSRDLMQISYFTTSNQNQNNKQKKSFRFEKQDNRDYPKINQRYSKLQNLLETAKKNSLQQFYKNIDQQNKAYNQQPQKFTNYPQFKNFIKQLKQEKKNKQLIVAQRQLSNPFQTINSIKMFRTQSGQNLGKGGYKSMNGNQYKNQQRNIPQQNQYITQNKVQAQKPQYNFTKKTVITQKIVTYQNPVPTSSNTNHFLPNQFAQQHFFEINEDEYQKVNPVAKYNNFYQGQKLPQKAAQFNKDEDAIQFFGFQSNKGLKKQKQTKQSLQPIRQQKHNSFERTFEQQKLDNLIKNYQNMRKDFEQLMTEFKSTNQGHRQKVITQLKKIADEKHENQLKQQHRIRRQKKQRQNIQKNQKLDLIKDQLNKIKTADKDILFVQINKKIEQLQNVVRSALDQINQQKQAKVIPKVTNYFCQHQNKFQNIDRQFQNGIDAQIRQIQIERQRQRNQGNQQYLNRSHQQSRELFTQNIINIPNKNPNLQSPSQYSQKGQSRSNKSNQESKSRIKTPQNIQYQQNSRYSQSASKKQQNNNNNYYSPLDLHLHNSYDNQYQQNSIQQQFIPQQFAQQYYARQYQGYTKNLRNSLLQKSSVVYQSFDFHVSSRFSIIDDPIHPLIADIRIGNKCSIDLYDVHCIIYGQQGPSILTDPSTIFQQQVKKNTSFTFQVSIDKICLQDNGFNIQISYKTDSMSKKKINFKIPLPLIQLIRPQFVYQQKFINDWNSLQNQLYIRPKRLDSNYLRSHQDLKLILPFIQISEVDYDCFSYGIMFRYPKSQNIFYIKIMCYVSGKASVQIRTQRQGDRKLKQQILNVLNFVLFNPM